MKLKKYFIILSAAGVNPFKMAMALRGSFSFFVDLARIYFQRRENFPIKIFPILNDRFEQAGSLETIYFKQDLYFSRLVYDDAPDTHIDVGSRIDGFVGSLLSFRKVFVADIRPLESNIDGLEFIQHDFMSKEGLLTEKFDSVSCLHTLEHFGLGRYGDNIDVEGWRVGLCNLASLLNKGGTLYLSVPIGKQRIEFNAHRVFNPDTIISEAATLGLKLERFAYLDDNIVLKQEFNSEIKSLYYGCGMFTFKLIDE